MQFNPAGCRFPRRVLLFGGALWLSVGVTLTTITAQQRKPATPKPTPATMTAAPKTPPPAAPAAGNAEANDQPPVLWCDAGFARSLIEQQLNETKKIFDRENRIQTLVVIADAIWEADATRARDAYRQAFELSLAHFDEAGRSKEEVARGVTVRDKDWRYEVIRSLYKHDAKLADELTQILLARELKRAEEKPAASGQQNEALDSSPGEQLLQAASRLLPNVQGALQLARQAIRYPLESYSIGFFLFETAATDRAAADNFFLEYLAAKNDRPIAELINLTGYAYGANRSFAISNSNYSGGTPADFQPNPALQRTLSELFLQRGEQLLQSGQAANADAPGNSNEAAERVQLVYYFAFARPQLTQSAPDLAARAQTLATALQTLTTAQERQRLERQQTRDGQSDAQRTDALKQQIAEATDPARKDSLIISLLFRSVQNDGANFSYDEIYGYLSDLSDEKLREKTFDYLHLRLALKAGKAGQFDDALRYARKVSAPTLRAAVLLELVTSMRQQPALEKRAAELLNETAELIEKSDRTVERAKLLLGVANLAARDDLPRGLESLRAGVANLNYPGIGKYREEGYFFILIGKGFAHSTSLPLEQQRLGKTALLLARLKFDDTISALQDIQDEGLRARTLTAIAAGCLRDDAELKRKQQEREKQRTRQRANITPQN